MPPEDIDDLFRESLAGHASPPGDELWARLQAQTTAGADNEANGKRLDQLFRQGLNAHATPPGRKLWERFEGEHLRPKKHRAAAWWPMALVAALALLLVAGGAGLWLGWPVGGPQVGSVATQRTRPTQPTAKNKAKVSQPTITPEVTTPRPGATVAANQLAQLPETTPAATPQKNRARQATRPTAYASTTPKARMSASGQSVRHLKGTTRQPDAATDHLPLVARTTTHAASHPVPTRRPVADEQRATTGPTQVAAIAPKPASAPEVIPAGPVPAPSLASTGGVITVDVRSGGETATRFPKGTNSAVASAEAPEAGRRLGGRLLQQAGHLVRGERISLAEVTGLPENLTLRATVAGHRLTKSIQL